MKKIIFWYMMIMSLFMIFEVAVDARSEQSLHNLKAYSNQILDISYMQDTQSLQVQLQHHPICMYTPLNYQEFADHAVMTYFFPRTHILDENQNDFADQFDQIFQDFGITVRIQPLQGNHYGLRMTFMLDALDNLKIVKVIDSDKKMVTFYIAKKI